MADSCRKFAEAREMAVRGLRCIPFSGRPYPSSRKTGAVGRKANWWPSWRRPRSKLIISDPTNSEFGQNLGCIPLLEKPGLQKFYKVIPTVKHIKEELIHSETFAEWTLSSLVTKTKYLTKEHSSVKNLNMHPRSLNDANRCLKNANVVPMSIS